MDPAPEKDIPTVEAWVGLDKNKRLKADVCKALFKYSGNDVGVFFMGAVREAHARMLELEAQSQSAAAEKRKLDDGDAADASSALKKPKISEAPVPLQAGGMDLASPNFPLGWPTLQQTHAPIKFGQPTLTAASGDATPTTWSSCPAMSSNFSGNTQCSNTGFLTASTQGVSSSSATVPNRGALASSTTGVNLRGLSSSSSSVPGRGGAGRGRGSSSSMGSTRGLFGSSATVSNRAGFFSSSAPVPDPKHFPLLFGNTKAKTPTQQEPECDEQFTFADRRSTQPQAPPQVSQPAQCTGSEQPPLNMFGNPIQGNNGPPPVSAVYKPPFAGVDMSSLKIPANSNVSVTLNVFQAPSSLQQITDSGAPRKLKCIQCNAFYMEAQNMALGCRRHTGRRVGANDPKLSFQNLPAGAYQVWDCCRKKVPSRGCYPCNHYAG